MPLLHSSVCASVCAWSQVNTHPYWPLTFYPQWQHWLVRSRGKKWKPSRRRRCIPLSCCVSYHCWTHGRAQMPERTAARRSRPRADTQTQNHEFKNDKTIREKQIKGGEYINGHAVWVEGFSICSAKCFGCDFSFFILAFHKFFTTVHDSFRHRRLTQRPHRHKRQRKLTKNTHSKPKTEWQTDGFFI